MNPKGVPTKGMWIKVFVKALPNIQAKWYCFKPYLLPININLCIYPLTSNNFLFDTPFSLQLSRLAGFYSPITLFIRLFLRQVENSQYLCTRKFRQYT